MSQEASRARSPRKPSRPSLGGGTPAQDRELRAQGRETVRRLLEAGMIEFEERGFQGVRVDDVVQRAGISHGTFYLYFSNKEDLFKALLKDALHDMEIVAGDFPVVTRDDNGLRVLRQWVRKFSKAYAAHGTVLRTLSSANAPAGMFGDGLRLFASIAEAMTTGMTAASRAAGQQQEHAELTAFACLLMLERVNYVISTEEVPLPGEEMADRIADIMYAAFVPVSLTPRRGSLRQPSLQVGVVAPTIPFAGGQAAGNSRRPEEAGRRGQAGRSASRPPRTGRTTGTAGSGPHQLGDRVERGPGGAHVVHPEHSRAEPRAHREHRYRALTSLIDRQPQGLADEVLVRHGDKHGPARGSQLTEPPGHFERLPGVLAEVVRGIHQDRARTHT
jgi:AcrR family transcriptional regulator